MQRHDSLNMSNNKQTTTPRESDQSPEVELDSVPILSLFYRRSFSGPMQMSLDGLAMIMAFALAYLLRFDFNLSPGNLRKLLFQLPAVLLFQFLALNFCGVYRFVWRYVSLLEIPAFMRAALFSAIPLLLMRLMLPKALAELRVPVSIVLINTGLMFSLIVGLRVLRRFLYEHYERRSALPESEVNLVPRKVLLIGAGRAGVAVAREIRNRPDMNLNPMGFLDDNPAKLGTVIYGLKVLGNSSRIADLTRKLGIAEVIITIANASHLQLRHIISFCEQARVKMRIIPALQEIIEGRLRLDHIRDVQIEDLLGRDQVCLDPVVIKEFVCGKVVMITGSGGSIGAEIARQVAAYSPRRLLLVERSEHALYEIDREIRQTHPAVATESLMADIGDIPRIETLFKSFKPELVFHAAAHKHVPLMESNAMEAVKNNVLATHRLGETAAAAGVVAFVLISSDKAVNPTSVMGATKRAAELVIQDLDRRYASRFLAVRFGNVLGSAGSVIPLFREQISKGGPVTVTHPDMVRYFMTIPEAVSLVLQAGAMGNGGEVFVLDMGQPVRVMDLASEMIRLSGLTPGKDIQIVITGPRPGEKLREELQTDNERVIKTNHPKIFIGRITPGTDGFVNGMLERLSELAAAGDQNELRHYLNTALPEARLTVDSVK